ncbi:MAG: MFS transporter [Candidatus Hodarchaeota archaeon]
MVIGEPPQNDPFEYDVSGESHPKPNFTGWSVANFLESTSRGSVDHFMPIFARLLGANSSQIGLMTGLFSLVSIFQLFWTNISLKLQKSRFFVILGWLVSFILFIPISLIRIGQYLYLLIMRTIQGFFYSASVSTQASLFAELIPQKERAKKVGTITWLGLGGAFCGTLFSGIVVSILSEILLIDLKITFVFLFVWTCILGLLASLIFFLSVPDYKPLRKKDPPLTIHQEIIYPETPSSLTTLQKISRYYVKFGNFWRFCLFSGIFYFGVNLAAPFFIILKIEVYHISFFAASVFTSISTISQVVLGLLIIRFGVLDKIGRKTPLISGAFLVALGTIGVTIPYYFGISVYEWGFFTWILMGMGWGIFNASLAVFLLDIVHPQYRMQLIAFYNTMNGLAMFLGPVLGGMIIEAFNNIPIVFLLRGIIILLCLFLLMRVKEPEIPGVLIHPIKYFFIKYFRLGYDRGAEITVLPIKVRKINLKKWLSKYKKHPDSTEKEEKEGN